MKVMSSREIKDCYALFEKTAQHEPVIHICDGRPTLVTISIERAKAIPELSAEIDIDENRAETNVLLEALGKGAHLSAFGRDEEVVEILRSARESP